MMTFRFIESMESRLLMSANPATVAADRARLVADVKAFNAALSLCNKYAVSDTAAINRDVRKYGAVGKALANKFKTDQRSSGVALKRDYAALLKTGATVVNGALRDVTILSKKPGDPAATTRLAGELATLANSPAGTKFVADWSVASALAVQDLTAAASLNVFDGILQADVLTAENHANACAASANTTGTTLQTDTTQFIADASA